GVPMANGLFPASQEGILVLTLMIFHRIQLMVGAGMALCYARRKEMYTGQKASASRPDGAAQTGAASATST
ncbi:hypothetical protein AUM95_22970, partial [Cronobacter sakazakii]|uniref:bile acid:sodium symporter n=1 Tax=Cronobacter sakazakii TaxID=28141 RepID=UPI000D5126A7